MYYVWFWEGSQVMCKVYVVFVFFIIFIFVCYFFWLVKLCQGVYYFSWVFLVFLGLFFVMVIFCVIFFCVIYFVLKFGFWLFFNLWEDVFVVDSFKFVWVWYDVSFFFFYVLYLE